MKEIVPFLAFDGNCREAMEFYQKCLGAELFLLPSSEAPGDLGRQAGILHATLSKGSTLLMAADSMPGMLRRGNDFTVMIQCESLMEIEGLFAALGEKGKVTMPLQDTFWGARFGTLTDQFGVRWTLQFAHPR